MDCLLADMGWVSLQKRFTYIRIKMLGEKPEMNFLNETQGSVNKETKIRTHTYTFASATKLM